MKTVQSMFCEGRNLLSGVSIGTESNAGSVASHRTRGGILSTQLLTARSPLYQVPAVHWDRCPGDEIRGRAREKDGDARKVALSHLARRGSLAASCRIPKPLNLLNPSRAVRQVMTSKNG